MRRDPKLVNIYYVIRKSPLAVVSNASNFVYYPFAAVRVPNCLYFQLAQNNNNTTTDSKNVCKHELQNVLRPRNIFCIYSVQDEQHIILNQQTEQKNCI